MRLAILYHHGGIYADVDVKPVKPFDPLLNLGQFVSAPLRDLSVVPFTPELNVMLSVPSYEPFKIALDYDLKGKLGSADVLARIVFKHAKNPTLVPHYYFHSDHATSFTFSIHWPHRLATWIGEPMSKQIQTRVPKEIR